MLALWASQLVLAVKKLPANAGDIKDAGSIPGWGRCPGEGKGTPLQYYIYTNTHAYIHTYRGLVFEQ